jgi:hypothetical protein
MSPRLRPHSFFILATLFVALLLGPPLSIAKNLPTVCNIFDKTKAPKSGPCDHRAMFSKFQDKSFEAGAVLFSQVDFVPSHFGVVQNNSATVPFPLASNTQSSPLRC